MRYFIIFYIYTWSASGYGHGEVPIAVEGFPNRIELNEVLVDLVAKKFNYKDTKITLTNFIEISESDYAEWVRVE